MGGHVRRQPACSASTTGSVRPTQIQWSRLSFASGSQIHFRDKYGNIRRTVQLPAVRVAGAGTPSIVPFPGQDDRCVQDEKFAEMFEQSWRALHEHFYDPDFPRCQLEQRSARSIGRWSSTA